MKLSDNLLRYLLNNKYQSDLFLSSPLDKRGHSGSLKYRIFTLKVRPFDGLF